ncbi:MAG: flagellin lysine-N-methylase [Blautia sp.]|nr:flagellin lysine-N-methylase [Blautia sp.]
MKHVWPFYMGGFHCLREKCPSSCCKGMAIEIDEDSLARYLRESRPGGERIRKGINWREGVFYQEDGCLMLTGEGLCYIWQTFGEEELCDTCKNYPQHVEDYPQVQEHSLCLSCPAVASLLFSAPYRVSEKAWRDEERDSYEYEEGEEELYLALSEERGKLLTFLEQEDLSLEEKAGHVLDTLFALQRAYDEGSFPGSYLPASAPEKDRLFRVSSSLPALGDLCKGQRVAFSAWREELEWFDSLPKEKREELSRSFLKQVSAWEEGDFSYERAMSHLLSYYEAVFFAGATYTGEIYACGRLGLFAIAWQEKLLLSRYAQRGKITREDFEEAACAFSRAIEHEDAILEQVLRSLAL